MVYKTFLSMVLEGGLEPPSLAALVPKTSAYTNSATPASFQIYFVFEISIHETDAGVSASSLCSDEK